MPQQSTAPRKKGTGLLFTRITDVGLVPRYLVDQIEDKEWSTEAFYRLVTPESAAGHLLGVFSDKKNVIKGFMWAVPSPLTERLFVATLSIDEDFQGKGIIGESLAICRRYARGKNLAGISAQTKRPIDLEKFGFMKSENVSIELEI